MEQQQQISMLVENMPFNGFLRVGFAERRTDSKGKEYLDLNLSDRSGEINCKMWNRPLPTVPHAGSVVKVEGTVQKYNGRMQMRIDHLSEARPDDDVDLSMLIACAPETPEAMKAVIEQTIESFESDPLKRIVREMIRLAGDRLDYYPAAMRMHHAERSGLLHHTTDMLRTAEKIVECYPFLNRELLLAGVIVHDLAKTAEMDSDTQGNVTDYTRDGLLVGHLVRGVAMLDRAAENVQAGGEWLVLLEHMMISHHGIPEYGSPKYPMFPEAEALHWIDMLDAKMNEMKSIHDRTPAGAFSEKIMSLDGRRMYHPLYKDNAE